MSTSSRIPSWSSQVILSHTFTQFLKNHKLILLAGKPKKVVPYVFTFWLNLAGLVSNLSQNKHWSCRLPLLGSLLHVPHVPGLLTNAAQWFIQRYGKLVTSFPQQRSRAKKFPTGWALPWSLSRGRTLRLWGRKRFVQPRCCLRQKFLSSLYPWTTNFRTSRQFCL